MIIMGDPQRLAAQCKALDSAAAIVRAARDRLDAMTPLDRYHAQRDAARRLGMTWTYDLDQKWNPSAKGL